MKEMNRDKEAESGSRPAQDNLLIGRNAVWEAIQAGRTIDQVYLSKGERTGTLGRIAAASRERVIVIKQVDTRKRDLLSGGANHQGVAASIAAHAYATLESILEFAGERGEAPFLILCDGIEDPHNLGAIIRTAEAAGVHGVILPERRSASLNATVAKTASGALEYMRVARVTNLSAAMRTLKARGVWIYGADMGGQSCYATDMTGPAALVIGAEGKGLSRLVRESCDVIVSLPMRGRIHSLNASVAAGILLYEMAKQRTVDHA
ncbi:MAG: 23S rRNA (guanosine(2251)-2'-O)-methyltransferase RlmB [Clostridiales bacterium]|nr:23S rRNA (guanosine(2251)-2'-O)-methyltransferase RlmB [Clostridiales bacterium]